MSRSAWRGWGPSPLSRHYEPDKRPPSEVQYREIVEAFLGKCASDTYQVQVILKSIAGCDLPKPIDDNLRQLYVISATLIDAIAQLYGHRVELPALPPVTLPAVLRAVEPGAPR